MSTGTAGNGYRPTPELMEQEPKPPRSRSSSSDDIWPGADATGEFIKRKSTTGMLALH